MKAVLGERDGDFIVELGLKEQEIYELFTDKIFADIKDKNGNRLGKLIVMRDELFPKLKTPS